MSPVRVAATRGWLQHSSNRATTPAGPQYIVPGPPRQQHYGAKSPFLSRRRVPCSCTREHAGLWQGTRLRERSHGTPRSYIGARAHPCPWHMARGTGRFQGQEGRRQRQGGLRPCCSTHLRAVRSTRPCWQEYMAFWRRKTGFFVVRNARLIRTDHRGRTIVLAFFEPKTGFGPAIPRCVEQRGLRPPSPVFFFPDRRAAYTPPAAHENTMAVDGSLRHRGRR